MTTSTQESASSETPMASQICEVSGMENSTSTLNVIVNTCSKMDPLHNLLEATSNTISCTSSHSELDAVDKNSSKNLNGSWTDTNDHLPDPEQSTDSSTSEQNIVVQALDASKSDHEEEIDEVAGNCSIDEQNTELLVIDGETEVDDLMMAACFANYENAALYRQREAFAKVEGYKPKPSYQKDSRLLDEMMASHGLELAESDDGEFHTDGDVENEDNDADDEEEGGKKCQQKDRKSAKAKLFCFDSVTIEGLPEVIPESAALVPIGTVLSVVEDTVLVQASMESHPLDLGSVLCCSDRRVIGPVSDTFGPVSAPFYVVCLPSEVKYVNVGTEVFADTTNSSFLMEKTGPLPDYLKTEFTGAVEPDSDNDVVNVQMKTHQHKTSPKTRQINRQTNIRKKRNETYQKYGALAKGCRSIPIASPVHQSSPNKFVSPTQHQSRYPDIQLHTRAILGESSQPPSVRRPPPLSTFPQPVTGVPAPPPSQPPQIYQPLNSNQPSQYLPPNHNFSDIVHSPSPHQLQYSAPSQPQVSYRQPYPLRCPQSEADMRQMTHDEPSYLQQSQSFTSFNVTHSAFTQTYSQHQHSLGTPLQGPYRAVEHFTSPTNYNHHHSHEYRSQQLLQPQQSSQTMQQLRQPLPQVTISQEEHQPTRVVPPWNQVLKDPYSS